MKIIPRRSPNQGHRPHGVKISVIVIHGTAGTSDEGDVTWCCTPAAKVSYHYIIGRDGTVYSLVDEDQRAWHAGVSEWNGKANVNDFSIGIGFSNNGVEKYTDAQYEAGHLLVDEIRRRWGIEAKNVVGHYMVSPKRKTDPWYTFQWGRLFQ